MAENKIDRANLRRHVQRIESYTSLISKQKPTLKINNMNLKKSRSEIADQKPEIISNLFHKEEIENEEAKDSFRVSSPANSSPSCSSDSSQDFQPNFVSNFKVVSPNTYQSELEVSSVMTRSATRKYATVGAIHNKFDVNQELKVYKKWPRNVAYSSPVPSIDDSVLRDVVSRSFHEVLLFCKHASVVKNEEGNSNIDSLELRGEFGEFIDLSPYFSQEPVIINGGTDETQITLHLTDNFLPQQFIDIMSMNEGGQSGTFVIQEDNEGFETITLHSENTYLLEDKYFSNISPNFTWNGKEIPLNTFPDNPMLAVLNDHTYALKSSDKNSIPEPTISQNKVVNKEKESEFNLENVLNELLLNTAILKCVICGETPEEMISLLKMAEN